MLNVHQRVSGPAFSLPAMMDDATFSNMMDGQAQPFSFSLFDPTTSPVTGVNSNNNTVDPNASNDGNSAGSLGPI